MDQMHGREKKGEHHPSVGCKGARGRGRCSGNHGGHSDNQINYVPPSMLTFSVFSLPPAGGMMGNPMMGAPPAMHQQQQQSLSAAPLLMHQQASMMRADNNNNGMMYNSNGGGMMSPMSGGGAPPAVNGNNPLYGNPPSPLGSQAGMNPMHAALASNLYANTAAAPVSGSNTPTGTSASMNEAEMLQQLMGEINRLKSELGVPPARN